MSYPLLPKSITTHWKPEFSALCVPVLDLKYAQTTQYLMSYTPGHCCLGDVRGAANSCHLLRYVKGSTGIKTMLGPRAEKFGDCEQEASKLWLSTSGLAGRLPESVARVSEDKAKWIHCSCRYHRRSWKDSHTDTTHHRGDKNQPKRPSSDCLVEESRHWAVNRQRRVMRHKDKWVRIQKLSSLSSITCGLGRSQCSFSLLATWSYPGYPEESTSTWVRKIWAATGQATWISQTALQHPSLQDFEETKVPPHKRRTLLG